MVEIWIKALLSTFAVSAIAGIGILFFLVKYSALKKSMFILVSFAVGALLGNVIFHLLPETFEDSHSHILSGLVLAAGLMAFFITERILHWHHHHSLEDNPCEHEHSFGYVTLMAESIHNFTDGVLIAASWLTSNELGMATTIAVILHEIPQEVSNFSILIHAGFSKRKALVFNLFSACTAIVGAVITLFIGQSAQDLISYILPFAAGGFIYLACSDLIPELNKQPFRTFMVQLIAISAGIGLMMFLSVGHSH
jgi:zinc and cadmium transporter